MEAKLMRRTARRIGVIGFEGASALDITGPIEAFAIAGRTDGRTEPGGHYETLLLGITARPFRSEYGVRLVPDARLADAPPLDTLIVAGGAGLREPATNAAIAAWLRAHAPRIRRVASVCTGAYGLAASGLLDGRRVTTHWRFASDLARRFPKLRVEPDALFVKDGSFYTSGGIAAGIDLALALIEEDFGSRTSLAVAREMVVYLKRPGGQEQFSEPLRQQLQAGDRFGELVAWMTGHLDRDLAVPLLAERVGMSPRHFGRRFREVFGRSPARYVEGLRLAAARDRLTAPRQTVERVASSVGFESADVFRRRFRERYGVAPATYRETFRSAGEGG